MKLCLLVDTADIDVERWRENVEAGQVQQVAVTWETPGGHTLWYFQKSRLVAVPWEQMIDDLAERVADRVANRVGLLR